MQDRPFFSVIIVNYNAGEFLQKAVDSLTAQHFQSFELFVVDNGSEDGSMEALDVSAIACAELLLLGRNSGFAEGNNIAVKQARGEWIVLLNADAVAEPDWLSVLNRAIEEHPKTAMFASTQIRMEEPHLLDGVGDGYTAYGYPWRGGYLHPVSEKPEFGSCFAPCGASAAYRRDTYLEHGGFDERFFCFVEDIDLAFRMRLSGEECLFLPDAIVHHMGGGMSGEESEFSVVHGARNRVWAYMGNMPTPLLLLTFPMHMLLTLYLLVWYFGRPYGAYVWRGTVMGWKQAFAIRRARNTLRKNRKISLAQLAKTLTWDISRMSAHKSAVR